LTPGCGSFFKCRYLILTKNTSTYKFYFTVNSFLSWVADDISWEVRSRLSIFADDFKVMGIVNSTEQYQQLQDNLTIITDWVTRWGHVIQC